MTTNAINPKDTSTLIGLDAVISEIQTNVGILRNSGLFTEELTPRDTIVEEINKATQRGMLGFTDRRSREKVKQTRRKNEAFAIQLPYQETIEDLTKEDVYQVAKDWDTATEEQIMDLYIKKLTAMRESIDNAHEFIFWTAAQGKTRDPFDGSVVLDMFAKTGVAQPTKTLDLTNNSLDVIAWMAEFRNEIVRANKRNSVVGTIEIMVSQAVYNKIIAHPSVRATYQVGWQASKQEYVNKVTNIGRVSRGEYGVVSEFEEHGVRFVVAPQTFILEDTGEEYEAVAQTKGFVITRGVRDGYKAFFGQSNSMTDPSLSKVYAKRSAIIDDAYFEITASSAPIAFTTVPELCFEITFTIA